MFVKTDSTIVITEVYRDSRRYPVDPIVLYFDEIESVKQVKLWTLATVVLTTVVVCAAAFVVYAWGYKEGWEGD
jgi:hypothetical protein